MAIVSADAVFSRNPVLGAKASATKYGFEIVHQSTYPLSTQDFGPVLNAAAGNTPDLLFLCSYLDDSIGLINALHHHAYRPKMVGASMIGPQSAAVRVALGPRLNGIVNYEYWAPVPSLRFFGVHAFLEQYHARAADTDVDALGHYTAPLAYAQLQVVAGAIEATRSLDDAALAQYTREAAFETVMGTIVFGPGGEWATPRVLQVQFQGITDHSVSQFEDGSRQVVVFPPEFRSGALRYPYADALV